MDFRGIHDRLRAIKAPGLLGADEPREKDPEIKKDTGRFGDSWVLIDPQQLADFLHVCRTDESLAFEQLIDLSAVDPAAEDEDFWIIVQLLSLKHKQRLSIKCMLPKSAATMPSTVSVYRASQWHERECAEMFGITFDGHPDPRHILLPDDWVGYPMRKDYEFPTEYHGVSCQ